MASILSPNLRGALLGATILLLLCAAAAARPVATYGGASVDGKIQILRDGDTPIWRFIPKDGTATDWQPDIALVERALNAEEDGEWRAPYQESKTFVLRRRGKQMTFVQPEAELSIRVRIEQVEAFLDASTRPLTDDERRYQAKSPPDEKDKGGGTGRDRKTILLRSLLGLAIAFILWLKGYWGVRFGSEKNQYGRTRFAGGFFSKSLFYLAALGVVALTALYFITQFLGLGQSLIGR